MCDLHDWVQCGGLCALLAMHAHLPRGVHRRLVDEELHLPQLYGAGGCCPSCCLWLQLDLMKVCSAKDVIMQGQDWWINLKNKTLVAYWSSAWPCSAIDITYSGVKSTNLHQEHSILWDFRYIYVGGSGASEGGKFGNERRIEKDFQIVTTFLYEVISRWWSFTLLWFS